MKAVRLVVGVQDVNAQTLGRLGIDNGARDSAVPARLVDVVSDQRVRLGDGIARI
jgi:hypothetical protein